MAAAATSFLLFLQNISFLLISTAAAFSIHDLLKSRGLPAGLFPKNGVKSFQLGDDGVLRVYLDQPCVARFENRVFFERVVAANLSYGGLTGVSGLSQEELFLWLPVRDIFVNDPSTGLILFNMGVARVPMSLSLFEEPPFCKPPCPGPGWVVERDVGVEDH